MKHRGFSSQIGHGSDSVENGQKEIKLWFPESVFISSVLTLSLTRRGIQQYKLAAQAWIYEP